MMDRLPVRVHRVNEKGKPMDPREMVEIGD
jgi:hypothetical protein